VSLLQSKIIEDLQLKSHGMELIDIEGTVSICGDDYLCLTGDPDNDRTEIGRFSTSDYDAMNALEEKIQELGSVIRNQMLREPPKIDAGLSDLVSFGRMGLDLKKLSPDQRHRFLQMMTSSAYDLIERWLDSPMVKSMYGSACFSGNFSSLKQPGSAIPFFHTAIGELDGEPGAWKIVKGGMGALTGAMAAFAKSKGVEIRTESAVEEILVEGGQTVGVRLTSGETIRSRCVLANTCPKTTFLKLLKSDHLDQEFTKDIQQIRMGHASLKVNLALSGLPKVKFFDPDKDGPWLRSDISIFPDIEGQEANYYAAAQGELPKEPRLEITIPSTVDDTLAPEGHHVMSILAKYYPFQFADGSSWDDRKEAVTDQIIDYVARVMPELKDLIIKKQMISPLDLEREYGLLEADIFHGRHDLDQLFSLRPHPKAAQYLTPIKNLYLCGSGAHPGGGVSGAPGYNAARRVIKDDKKGVI